MGEPRVDLERIKEEWLVGNSVVAFVGALLMAQAWEPSDVKNVIPIINVTVPIFPQAVILGIVTFLVVLSIVLAVASSVPRLKESLNNRTSAGFKLTVPVLRKCSATDGAS